MAYQLIYTSVRRGLIPGRSGYTVAARHRQIRERLVSEIERVSGYTYAKKGQSLKIYAHRKFDINSNIKGIQRETKENRRAKRAGEFWGHFFQKYKGNTKESGARRAREM